MIISFKVANFLSFKEEVEFSMVSTPYYKKKENHIFKNSHINILILAAIYGANASGKSNFVKALKFLKLIICKENQRITPLVLTKFKLDKSCLSKPTKFKLTYRTEKNNIYEYALEIETKSISRESLFTFVEGKKKLIFGRIQEGKNKYRLDMPDSLKKSQEDRIRFEVYQELLSEDKPFLTLAGQVVGLIDFTDALSWFEDQLQFLFPHFSDNGTFLRLYITDPEFREKAKRFIVNGGLGITDVKIEEMDINDFFGSSEIERKINFLSKLEHVEFIFFEQDGKEHLIIENEDGLVKVKRLLFQHIEDKQTFPFELNEESDGTRRFFHLLPSIIDSMDNSSVYVIDEIDRSLHPILIKELLKFYTENLNNNSGQIIFTTHEAFLMDLSILRQDELWFAEKNQKDGSTEMYPLTQFKPRFDLDLSKNYLKGKFGGIPFIQQDSNSNWDIYE